MEQQLQSVSHTHFRIFCLFRDLHNMRSFIRQTWEEYCDNKLDVMTASVVTDTAMQLARAAADEFIKDPSVMPQIRMDQMKAQMMLYEMACYSRGNDKPSSTELGLTFHVDMAKEAEWCFLPTSSLLQSFAPIMQRNPIPDFEEGKFGYYNPKADRSRMSVAQRFKEDKILLLGLLPDFCMIQEMGGKWPVRDECTHGFCEYARTKKVTIWLSFAAQILLDINHTLRPNSERPWKDLHMTGLRVSKTIADFKKLSATHPKPAFWPKEGDQEIERIQNAVDVSITVDPLHTLWQVGDPAFLSRHKEYFYLKSNPVLAGLITFHLTLRMQVAGQTLVTQWYDVQQMAFLYNLVNTIPDLQLTWRDIEAFINIHGEKHHIRRQ